MNNHQSTPSGLSTTNEPNSAKLSRRTMLQSGAAITAAAGMIAPMAHAAKPVANGHPIFGGSRNIRNAKAMRVRFDAAQTNLQDYIEKQESNGDEGLDGDYRASFTKALPHDNLGEVDPSAYQQLLTALSSGENSDFEQVPLGGDRKLANPQGAYRFEMVGRDSHNTWMRPAPVFAGYETAAEMGELYWKALCRDIPFADYDSNADIASAVADLNGFSGPVGPKDGGSITPGTIFRGETVGDLAGPYISQFLFRDVPYGGSTIVQKYATPVPGDDFVTDKASWLAVQNGVAPPSLVKSNPRYISDARALGEFVHVDFTFQTYLSATLMILGMPDSLDIGNLYRTSSTQGAFVSLGGPDILNLVSKAGSLALTGAWYQKWLVHRRARPEVYGGRLHHQLTGEKDYGLPAEIGNSEAVSRVLAATSGYFLPMAYPEASPTHPSYPAGHATIAGACCTVMKAFFNENLEIPDPVVPDVAGSTLLPYTGTLTLGNEINKLANNIALGRDWAGVHYRSDGVDGLEVGEQQAIGMLRDYSRTYNEDFDGFTLTRFNGETIRIQDGTVY